MTTALVVLWLTLLTAAVVGLAVSMCRVGAHAERDREGKV